MAYTKHFVTFYSPGTFVHETTTRDIGSWDPVAATAMAGAIIERHGARPFGFKFVTRLCSDPIDDGYGGKLRVEPRETESSGMYYLNGHIETLEEIAERADKGDEILLSNMRNNGIDRVVVTANGYRSVNEFKAGDKLVDAAGNVAECA